MREITSATNPFIKQLRALIETKKARRQSQSFVIEGWRGIDTLLCHLSQNYQLETLVIAPEWIDDPRLPKEIDTVLLPALLLNKVSDVQNTQGVLGIIKHTPLPFSVPDKGKLLLLDNLRDPGNLGTLIRSAVGAGFDGILLYGDCVDPYSPKVIRSTMGTFAYCNLWSIADQEIEHLQADGFELCITTGLGGTNLYETRFSNKTILAIGSEAHGVCDALQQRAVKKITIPLNPQCESLNAAVAGSICMFHIANVK